MQSVGLEESASNLLLLMTQKGSFGLPSLFEFQTETLPNLGIDTLAPFAWLVLLQALICARILPMDSLPSPNHNA
jgi:hypothetical protein